MKLVKESILFQRGLDTKQALKVGVHRDILPPFSEDKLIEGYYLATSNLVKAANNKNYKGIIRKKQESLYGITSWTTDKEELKKMNLKNRNIELDTSFEDWIEVNVIIQLNWIGKYDKEAKDYLDKMDI